MKPFYFLLVLGLAAPPLAAQSLSNAGGILTVGPGATLHVPGTLDNKPGGTLTNAGTLQVGGDLTNTGTLTSAGVVQLNGTSNQQLSPGGASLTQLEIANTGSSGQNVVTVATDLPVTQQLTLTSGMVQTPVAATLLLPATGTVTGEAPGRYVRGNLQVTRDNVSGPTDFGNGAVLSPPGNLGTVTVKRTAGLLLPNVSYGQNAGNASLQGIDRIWTITSSTAPTAAVPVALSWLPENDHNLSGFGDMQAWQASSDASWQAVGAPGAAAALATLRTFSFSTAVLGALTVSNAANPLPVELVAFTAERQNDDAQLRWTTASEKNNDRFEVESSVDGRTFERLGAVAGQGSSTRRHDYRYLDANLGRYRAALVYYRLRQVDRNGTASFSEVRTVQPRPSELTVQAYPNPFGAALTVRIQSPAAGPATLTLRDAVGRLVRQQTVFLPAGRTEVELAGLAEQPAGVYLLSVQTAQTQQRLKVSRE